MKPMSTYVCIRTKVTRDQLFHTYESDATLDDMHTYATWSRDMSMIGEHAVQRLG